MKKAKDILLWVLTVFMLLAALVYMPSFSSLLMILFAVIALPVQKVKEFWASKRISGALKAGILCALFVISVSMAPIDKTRDNSGGEDSDVAAGPEEADPQEEVPDSIDVSFDVSIGGVAGMPVFIIKTNLPDETELLLTVNGDNGSKFQDKVIVEDGTAQSVQFGSESNSVPGKFSLHISMSLPSLQSDAVREVIGENGEYISGPYVKESDIDESNFISAVFEYDFSSNDGSTTKNTVIEAPPLPPELTDSAPTSGGNGNGDNFNTYSNPSQQKTSSSYVLNTSTMKFHYPSCNSVEKIAPDNYATSSASRDSLISQGYDPCGNCKP